MYKFLRIFFCVFILLITPIALSCPESFQDLKFSTIQEVFSDPVNYERYSDQNGYISFVKKVPNTNSMKYVFVRVSEALGKKFKKLKWQKFQGSVKEFEDLRSKILDEKGNIREEYLEMEGYAEFAKEHYDSDMNKAFQNISAVLSKVEFKKLKWQKFQGSVKEFEDLRSKILDEKGNIREEYLEMEGYAEFAKEHYDSDMNKAFQNISAVLSKVEFKRLKWQAFLGSVKEFEDLRSKILDEKGNIREEYLEMSGYAEFAKEEYDSDMSKAFINISAVLSKVEFKRLKWQKFQGSVKEFEDLRSKILDEKGNIREEYLEMEGYAEFAKEHYDSDMNKAFQNISAVLSKVEFKKLKWQKFQGSVKEFEDLRSKILDEKGNIREEYLEMEGYAEFAKKEYDSDMQIAFRNVSAVLSKVEFKRLKWQAFLGSVKEFEDLRSKILDEKGNIREEYLEMEGYAEFAKKEYDSDMSKAFKNISAVLGGYWGMKKLDLGWKQFQGSVSEYKNLIQLFSKYPIERFQGIEGQKKVAKEIFEGHNKRTYRNVSVLREMLLGSREAFTDLEWSLDL